MKRVTLILANKRVITKYFLLAILFNTLIIYNVKSQQMVHTGTVTTVFETRINLTAGIEVKFEAKNLSPGSDAVINLLSPEGLGVMSANNGGPGVAEQLTYLPTMRGSYFLIIRSKTMQTRGTADLYKNGISLATGIVFGGWQVSLQNLRIGETIQTVKLPGGSNGMHSIYVLKENQIDIQIKSTSLSPDIALVKFPATIGNRLVIVGTNNQEGSLRLICNDAGISEDHDADKDGLGTELEAEIGTCASRSGRVPGCDCSQIADARDTDGDGIPDGWEVLGRYDMKPFQLLPKWGANPRHKDLFIEVDFMRRTWNENSSHHIDNMLPNVARHFAGIYGDVFTTDPRKRSAHAEVLRNPDRAPGVSVHLDIGIEPQTQSDMTIFGNWGGFNSVDAVQPNGTPCNSSDVACKGIAANVAWKNEMEVARRGIFRYTLGYSSGGGSNGNTFACDFNFHDLTNPAHEFGHTLGMGHSGPNGITRDIDPNCKPNYPSIMNYAFLYQDDVGFSDGASLPAVNNASLREWNAVSPSNTPFLDILENEFQYWINRTNGHVDWNRNGDFEPAGQIVKAYANYRPGYECEFTRYNQFLVSNAQTAITPVLARLKNRLYVFYADHGSLKYRFSTSSLNCPQPAAIGCDNAVWGPEKDAGMPSVGVDVMNDGNGLVVVSVELFGKIMEKRLTLLQGNEIWTQPVQIPGSAQGEPSLSFGLAGSYMVYKGSDGFIHFNKMIEGQWQTDQIAHSNNHDPIKTTAASAYPAIIQTLFSREAHLPPETNFLKSLFGLFPDENGKLDMWRYKPTTDRWEKTDLLEERRPGPIYGKPAMAYVPFRSGFESPGRLYMVYIEKPGPGIFKGTIKMRMSYIKVKKQSDGTVLKDEKIGLDSYFDNSGLTTYGISLFYEQGKDSNLRSVLSVGARTPNYNIMFRPKADGINDFEYKNYNDWETIRKNLCKQVVNPTGTDPNAIRCAVD